MKNPQVLEWVREAPFSNPEKLRASPNFSYEQWFVRGRKLPDAAESLIELLDQEDPQKPSGDGMRCAYALGWIGSRNEKTTNALIKSLTSRDNALRSEAVSALGRLEVVSALPLLEDLVKNPQEDINVRGNACVSIGRLRLPSGENTLREALKDPDQFIVACANEGLRLLREGERK